MTRRIVLDLGDPDRLAEALVLGAVDGQIATAAQLRTLAQAYTEQRARVEKLADDAQVAVGELEAVRAELASARCANAELTAMLAGQPPSATAGLDETDQIELLIGTAARLAGDAHIGLLLNVLANACLRCGKPHSALAIVISALERTHNDLDRVLARARRVVPAQVPVSDCRSQRLEYRERPYSDVIALLAALYFLTGDQLEGDRHVRVLAGVLAPPTRPQ